MNTPEFNDPRGHGRQGKYLHKHRQYREDFRDSAATGTETESPPGETSEDFEYQV